MKRLNAAPENPPPNNQHTRNRACRGVDGRDGAEAGPSGLWRPRGAERRGLGPGGGKRGGRGNPARKRAHGCGRGDRKVGGRAGLQPSRFRKGHGAEGRMARGATQVPEHGAAADATGRAAPRRHPGTPARPPGPRQRTTRGEGDWAGTHGHRPATASTETGRDRAVRRPGGERKGGVRERPQGRDRTTARCVKPPERRRRDPVLTREIDPVGRSRGARAARSDASTAPQELRARSRARGSEEPGVARDRRERAGRRFAPRDRCPPPSPRSRAVPEPVRARGAAGCLGGRRFDRGCGGDYPGSRKTPVPETEVARARPVRVRSW